MSESANKFQVMHIFWQEEVQNSIDAEINELVQLSSPLMTSTFLNHPAIAIQIVLSSLFTI